MSGEADVPVVWVDAFADGPFTGNPAAVCFLDEPADDGWMQRLAFELGLSETAFVWPDGDALSLRWFTPATEVALCGHATLAAAHALRETGHWSRWPEAAVHDGATFRTRSGTLVARFDGALVEIDLPADAPVPCTVPAPLAGWMPRAAAAGSRLASVGGGPDLLVELPSPDAVRAIVPDLPALAALPHRVVVATAAGGGEDADYVHRVFGPAVGVDEDPVTGSAQCLLGPYWAERLGRWALEAAQLSRRGGRLRVVVDGDRVRVAGHAVTVLSGRLSAAAGPSGRPGPAGDVGARPLPTMGLPEP